MKFIKLLILLCVIFNIHHSFSQEVNLKEKTRIIITSDAEIDDECSFVRCLLYANDFDIEGIISTSSQYHAHDHNWAGDDWYVKYLDAYAVIYPNLIKHDTCYPEPDSLKAITFLGNVSTEGDMIAPTPGSQHIVKVLLDTTDNRPIWLQAWGGMNTIARALKSIEEEHPDKMEYVASKCRFFFIWEQDNTFQSYIRPHWATPYNIQTIISDQFITFGYWWQRWNMPEEPDSYFRSPWMKENIFKNMNDNPLIAYYNENTKEKLGGKEDFIGEGDSPSFINEIPTGLRSTESPDWGGWGGRYVLIRENTWLDKVPIDGYNYPSGRWYTSTGWGRQNYTSASQELLEEYFKPITRWIDVIQNDFASRVDWCLESFEDANHPPVVVLTNELDMKAMPGDTVNLSALGTSDPDGDELNYRWWHYLEAGSFPGIVEIQNSDKQDAMFIVPENFYKGETIHIICEVSDTGSPVLTRYQRVVVETDALVYPKNVDAELTDITKIELTWEDNSEDETGFRIERAKGESGVFDTIAEVQAGTTTFADTELEELTLYRYRISAFNDSLTSGYEGIASVSTLSTTSLPAAVSDPSPENNAANIGADTTLMWKGSINADSYDVYFGTDNPPPFISNQSEAAFKPGGLKDGETYYWRVDGKNTNGITEGILWSFTVEGKLTSLPAMVQNELIPIRNYPNPFSAFTRINYELKSHSEVNLSVYNVMGKHIASLVNQWQTAGEYSVTFNAGNLESGVYFFILKTGLSEQRGKMLLMK